MTGAGTLLGFSSPASEPEVTGWLEVVLVNFGWVIGLALLIIVGAVFFSVITRTRKTKRERDNDAAASVYWGGSGGLGG